MGALTRQVVPVLLKGLDQLAPKQTGIMSGLDALLNMYAQQGGQQGYEFVPRPGVRGQGNGFSESPEIGLATLGPQLLRFGRTKLLRRATDGWHRTGASSLDQVTVNSVSTTPLIDQSGTCDSCDVAYVNGYTVSATAETGVGLGGALTIEVRDANGALLDIARNPGASAYTQVRIAVVGTTAIIFWHDGATSIKCVKFDASIPFLDGTTITTISAIASAAFNPLFDVQAIPATGKIAIFFHSTGGPQFAQRLLTASTMALGGVSAYGTGGNATTFGYVANNFSTPVLMVAWISATTGLHVDQYDSATLIAGTATTYDAASTAGANITGYRTGVSTTTVFFTVKGTLPFDDVIKMSTGGAASTIINGRAIASRATDQSGGDTAFPLFLTKYRGIGQTTYFLVDNLGNSTHDLARAMPDVAGFDPSNNLFGILSLPNLTTTVNANTYLTAGLKATSLVSGTGGLSSTTGAAAISVVMSDGTVGRPVELNGVLHIPGAMPLLYDGVNVVEDGFPIAPEQSDAYVLAGGGLLTASSTYTYRYVFEWTDSTGALHQSAPNLVPQQAVLGAGQTQVTHSIPTVITSRKTTYVKVAVYRTPSNGDGSVYYRAGSVSFPPIGGITLRQTFLDQMSDTVLVTKPPLYTDGNILENLAPPPCTAMALHRGRILVGGIEGDPTAIWSSKNVTPGFGIAYSDALVSRLGNTNEPITALGSMDSYAAAFTNTTTWSSSDEYPDDTGVPGVLRFTQASATNGCAGPRLIARADDGLTCWQAKTSFANGPGPGPWRLSRGLAWEWIGQGIQLDAAAMTPRAIVPVPGLNQMRVVGQTATVLANVLVRETTFDTWATWTYLTSAAGAPTFVDAVVWLGAVAYLGADGQVQVEDTSIYGDSPNGAAPATVAHLITLSPFNFAGVAGYQRIYVGQLTGRLLGTAALGESLVLAVTQTIDGLAMAAKNRTLSPDNDGLFNGVEFDPGPNGKCSAYQLTISNAAGGANDARCAWTLAAVTMEVGIKPNVNRLPPAKRAV